MTPDKMAQEMLYQTALASHKLALDARAFLRRSGYPEFKHFHRGVLRWAGPVELCVCGAFRDGHWKANMEEAEWIVPGAAQYTLEQAEGGSRLAIRALNEEFQYAS